MEKITILGISQLPTMVHGKEYVPDILRGYFYVMNIKSDCDGLEREVFMGFRQDGTGIYANDYRNNVQFLFDNEKLDIRQCEIGGEYKVKSVKMQCSEMVASIFIQTQTL